MKMSLLVGAIALSLAGPTLAQNWNTISRSPNNAFMVEVDAMVVTGDVTTVQVATVPRSGEATDYSHSVETYEFKCEASSGELQASSNMAKTVPKLTASPKKAAAGNRSGPTPCPTF